MDYVYGILIIWLAWQMVKARKKYDHMADQIERHRNRIIGLHNRIKKLEPDPPKFFLHDQDPAGEDPEDFSPINAHLYTKKINMENEA